MNFRTFFSKSTFTLLMVGDSNWDYFLMEFPGSQPSVVSLAKDGSGAEDSFFGSLEYFNRVVVSAE